ncbi:alkylation response protein AidB-like acyl-CoA dehydrogenase [Leucobacter exalbidus]|uniref:Alkylation response protein AidB-like acyl-CoA dehydrogenase n=1 Tax=Leucobacter exalbidus TaxID=662960 RepID=A0A940PX47_9MICO|nr:acyl-CoA dehydrogenase family protein [Leucobacter exalbidus]MBP1325796.1 alkylation response protein AidB-like acyl-CoA dehydrogenase [Leucobacter exalbidus]
MSMQTPSREARYEELAQRFLPTELLERFRERAAVYDRENRFCAEDIVELAANGYLTCLVPAEFGGPEASLDELSCLQQRLATAAPATALAVNMHLMCTGVARVMRERGDQSLDYVLTEAMAGEIFAFGISEPANDWVLQGSQTQAVPQPDGGYLFTGTKIFTSLSPAWTRLIVHGLDTTDSDAPELVYGFIERPRIKSEDPATLADQTAETVGGTILTSSDWDVLGMRASHSRTTRLEGALVRPERVARKLAPGRTPDLLVFAITSCFQLLVGSVYTGVAWRALELGAAGLHKRRSVKTGASLAENPEARARLADAHRAYLAAPAQLAVCARDLDEGIDHGARWPLLLVAARLAGGDAARSCAEAALMCTSGSGYGNGHEMSRIFRDATAGLFHPPSADSARPMYAAALLDN